MKGMKLTAVIRNEDDLFVAWCPELDVASQGASVDESLSNLKEAVELYLEDEDARRPVQAAVLRSFEVADDAAAGAVGS